MSLHVEMRGSGRPLVLLHGFTQTARLWGPFGDLLARDFTLVGIALPGHAGSDTVRADLPGTATLVAGTVTSTLGDGAFDMLGYSLGARVALHVATMTERAPSRMILIGATGGMDDPEARRARRRVDEATARALEASGDVDAFLARWVSGPLFAHLGSAALTEERRRNTAAGLASSLRLAGAGTQVPLWDSLASLATPVLAMAGTDDSRFASHALRLAQTVPEAVASLVPGGGHAVHLGQPALAARHVRHWLESERH